MHCYGIMPGSVQFCGIYIRKVDAIRRFRPFAGMGRGRL